MTSGTPSNAPQLPNSNPNINNTFPPNRRQAAQLQPWHLPAAPVTDPYIADDPYLSLLATDHFSSPSLPPLNSSPLPSRARANLPKPLEVGDMPGATPSRRRGSAGGGIVDLTKEEPHADISGIDPNTPIMPPITRRRAAVQQQSGSSAAASRKRRHSSTSSSRKSPARPKSKRKATTTRRNSISSPFSDDEPPEAADESHDSIDLTNATEVPPELLVPKPDKRTKLGKFQCVICMDDVTALTVTHCGHLFCSECLHSALHIDSVKKVCPVCRTKVDLNKKAKNAKSFYHLELKVVTATKKGKRPAG
ncbi:hypothetical protein F4778DRAFT_775061 [Xylariomycetidae sp. FL2044]|nr:hypothetical protein F4778DRAFT_775061 [Xylariomycetidae sp. FL2044]